MGLSVEEARKAVKRAMREDPEMSWWEDEMLQDRWLDALIAAVRAEEREAIAQSLDDAKMGGTAEFVRSKRKAGQR